MDYRERAEMLLSGNYGLNVQKDTFCMLQFEFTAEFEVQARVGKCAVRFNNAHKCLSVVGDCNVNAAFIDALKEDSRVTVVKSKDDAGLIDNAEVVFVYIKNNQDKEFVSDYVNKAHNKVKLFIILDTERLDCFEYIDFDRNDTGYISNNTHE